MKSGNEILNSFYNVWSVVTVLIFIILLLPFIAERDFILANTPQCIYKAASGEKCVSCGMTSAFIDISSGDLASAAESNGFGIFLYGLFILNTISFAFYSVKKFMKKNN